MLESVCRGLRGVLCMSPETPTQLLDQLVQNNQAGMGSEERGERSEERGAMAGGVRRVGPYSTICCSP